MQRELKITGIIVTPCRGSLMTLTPPYALRLLVIFEIHGTPVDSDEAVFETELSTLTTEALMPIMGWKTSVRRKAPEAVKISSIDVCVFRDYLWLAAAHSAVGCENSEQDDA